MVITWLKKIYDFFKRVKIPKNFYSEKFHDWGIIGRTVILLAVPFIFTWLMFDPLATFDLRPNTKNEPRNITGKEINKNLTSFVLANLFQTTLDLGWYKVCFENLGALAINGHTVVNRKDRGDVQIRVKQGPFLSSVEDYYVLKVRPFEKRDCLRFNGGNDGLTFGTTTVSLGAPVSDMSQDLISISQKLFKINFTVDFTRMHLYIQQDWIFFWIKYGIILIAWGSLLLLVCNLFAWVTKRGV